MFPSFSHFGTFFKTFLVFAFFGGFFWCNGNVYVYSNDLPADGGLEEGAYSHWLYESLQGGFSKSLKNPSSYPNENIFLRANGLHSDKNFYQDAFVFAFEGKIGVGTHTPDFTLSVQVPQNIFSISALAGNGGIIFADSDLDTAEIFFNTSVGNPYFSFQNTVTTLSLFGGGDIVLSPLATMGEGGNERLVITGNKICSSAGEYIIGIHGNSAGDTICAPMPPIPDKRCRYQYTKTPFGKNCVFFEWPANSCQPVVDPACSFIDVETGKANNYIGNCQLFETPPIEHCSVDNYCEVMNTETYLRKNHVGECIVR